MWKRVEDDCVVEGDEESMREGVEGGLKEGMEGDLGRILHIKGQTIMSKSRDMRKEK